MKIIIIQLSLIISTMFTIFVLTKSILHVKNKLSEKLHSDLYLLSLSILIIAIIILANFYFYLIDLQNIIMLTEKITLYQAISDLYSYLIFELVLLLINSLTLIFLKIKFVHINKK